MHRRLHLRRRPTTITTAPAPLRQRPGSRPRGHPPPWLPLSPPRSRAPACAKGALGGAEGALSGRQRAHGGAVGTSSQRRA
eukprot:6141590-Pleurochrysis_carterae.AAC.2